MSALKSIAAAASLFGQTPGDPEPAAHVEAGTGPSRRSVLVGGGSLVVGFSLFGNQALAQEGGQNGGGEGTGAAAHPEEKAPALPGSLKTNPQLDSWIRIDADGAITVFTGKAELGQGIKTALSQLAAEELGVEFKAIRLVTASTGVTPNEGYTAGSHSMQDSGTAIMNAAAQVREILIGMAGTKLNLPAEQLKAENAAIVAPDGRKLGYGEIVAGQRFNTQAQPTSKLRDPLNFTIIGQEIPRVDIPGKVTGGVAYVQDLRLPGMVHARVVRPPSYGAQLTAIDTSAVEKLPGVLKIVRDGSFLAVVTAKEFQAVTAMRALQVAAEWQERPSLPNQSTYYKTFRSLPSDYRLILDSHAPTAPAAKTVSATFHRPHQSHGSIGPSCAVAHFTGGKMTVWTHTQGVYPLRKALTELLALPDEQVQCIHTEGSGCYGHNGADDVAADAALIARAFPDKPVRVQWMREDEHGWEPYGSAMITELSGSLDAGGKIVDFQFEVWSNTHNGRPGPAGNLLAAQYLEKPFTPAPPTPIPQPEGGGDRNSIPLYHIPNAKVVEHFVKTMPLRVSAMRGLGAYMNIFSIESFMDEMAVAAGADPVEFRLRHMEDARARDVISKAAEEFGWSSWKASAPGRGRGFAFARYKNLGAYCAIAAEVEVERETGAVRPVRFVAATDSGQVVNPNGIRNQVEGAIVQSSSWTLFEQVTYDNTRISSRTWSTYPILRFPALPDTVEVHIIDRPGLPFLGTGECGQGPTSAALANAVANAVGVRVRDLPLTPNRVKTAIGV
ncbi:CO or xanthine dehydrogenase, Mo-binding subunit [Faunimonas pinastri]|uniref:CO or xanthine dehydrogenase, Mo-binding subunit n=1 Tax=Faunimonas pinastri TaxID=1855383 RepID=A0A1H9P0H3_9HYPH|nr:molybdopterin cofactor-binding domain-containing protein [Faunimonas pinastri]SER41631.1 CO or xanthine dehydrogenase, Mo-binding subunit [Faunimonas pinastri]